MDLDDPIVTRIVIQRNRSLDKRGLARVLAILAIPVGGFMALSAFAGWWPILSFSTVVFLALAAVLYGVMTAAREREVVTVTARHVVIESGRFGPRMRVELDRYWTRVEARGGRRPVLALIARDVVVEIAAALSVSERKTLARRLRSLVGVESGRPESSGAVPEKGSAHEGGRR